MAHLWVHWTVQQSVLHWANSMVWPKVHQMAPMSEMLKDPRKESRMVLQSVVQTLFRRKWSLF